MDVKTRKVKEFSELKQGNLNVNDYILKFEEGCLFVPFIASNDKDRGEHFMRGLRAEIRRDVRMSKAATYKQIVEKALLAEQDEKEIEKERQLRRQSFNQKSQALSQSWKGGYKREGKEEYRGKTHVVQFEMNRPLCPKCSKPHKGECFVGANKCYRCGGHNIVLPSGDVICPTSVIKACPVQVNEETFFADFIVADLIVIPMIEFDVNKMLVKGCQGFLASVMDVSKEYCVDVNDIEIVREYSDVFADNVPGLPPDREVEFVIDVVLGTGPISKAPYQMAPTE
ncbi:uncharacterized protein LOC142521863 [Primulina tabacum]|uniref:uncharacterized protein LOC142521863 n=1 Tax=Primulina tabacum TaxID=48773 RepID=UPI003F593147